MIKKILATSLVAASLIFSGCGGSSEGEDQLATQQMLDNGDFVGVILKLESSANSTSDYLALASAYMGKAGFSLSSIIGTVVASADSANGDSFATYVKSSKASSNQNSLNDLDTAVAYYQKVVNNKCSDRNAARSGAESDICLYVGLSKVSQTAVTIGYIADDVSVLTDSVNKTDDKLTASTCAMEYASTGNSTNNNCTILDNNSTLTFTESNNTYEDINVTVNNQTFEYLITDTNSTVITNGFCTLNSFTTRVDDNTSANYNSATYHVCPINESANAKETTTEEILVNALNEGTDSVGLAVSDDVKADIDEFKQDIIKTRTNGDTNTTITLDDIIKYLNDRNK